MATGNWSITHALESLLGMVPQQVTPLTGGCVGEVYRVWLPDGTSLVAKVDTSHHAVLSCEGFMLGYLRQHTHLPVPAVHHCSDTLLVMDFLEGDSHFSAAAEHHAAELLAELHTLTADTFGFERDTLIGGLHQPNPWTPSWLDFFRDHRLCFMGQEAYRAGRLPQRVLSRLEKFATHLDEFLSEPTQPALIHGDVWTTNVLAKSGKITGLLDPAIYFAHPEIELAFITLFGTFGDRFFQHYHELHPIEPGFFDLRKSLYNLYPLLVHVRLFGGGYVPSVEATLSRVGF